MADIQKHLFTFGWAPDLRRVEVLPFTVYEAPDLRVVTFLGDAEYTRMQPLPRLLSAITGGYQEFRIVEESYTMAGFAAVVEAPLNYPRLKHWRGYTPDTEAREYVSLRDERFRVFRHDAICLGRDIDEYLEEVYAAHVAYYGKNDLPAVECESVEALWERVHMDLVSNWTANFDAAYAHLGGPELETIAEPEPEPETQLLSYTEDNTTVSWELNTSEDDPDNVDEQLKELLAQVPDGPMEDPLVVEAKIGLKKILAAEEQEDVLLDIAVQEIDAGNLTISKDVDNMPFEEVIQELEKRSA